MSIWLHTLDVTDLWASYDESSGNEGFIKFRDEVVSRIKSSDFFSMYDDRLVVIVFNLSAAEDVNDFDDAWSELYDWADDARVWLATT